MEILIAGGGIGGLVAALSLHARGHDVHVFEAVREIRELGVGINVLPHAMRGLDLIGLTEPIIAAGVATQELAYFNKHGQLIWAEPRGVAAGYAWPQVSINRGRLQSVLLAAARERLGAERVSTDHRFVGFDEAGDRVTAHFTDGRGEVRHPDRTGDLLIAADGIHSTARKIFYPDEGLPDYSGIFMWRAVSRAKAYRTEATMAVIGHWKQRFIAYPITPPDQDGLSVVNWIAQLPVADLQEREDWNRKGALDDFLEPFLDWNYDWLDIPALCRSAEASWEYPMVDREPLPRWSFGRTTLLGDAAHPMYPIGSNGGSQAILDAEALAEALDKNDDPVEALKAYEAARLPMTADIIRSNRQQGPEIVMQMAEDRAPGGFDNIEDVIPRAELEGIAAKYKHAAGFDKDSLNAKRES